MSVPLYADVHIRGPVIRGLRSRGVDILTAREDGAERLSDSDLLDRATVLGRVLVTQDDDLFSIAASRLQDGKNFAGLVYSHQMRITIGQMIDDLELIAQVNEPAEMVNKIEYLPL